MTTDPERADGKTGQGDEARWRFAGTLPGAPGTPTPEAAPRGGARPEPASEVAPTRPLGPVRTAWVWIGALVLLAVVVWLLVAALT